MADLEHFTGENEIEECEHDFDADEGYTCLNCGAQKDIGELIDEAEYDMER